jgi:quercetin dioxygenase-like cupin family protein
MSLTRLNLTEVANKMERPFVVKSLAALADLTLSVFICQGQVAWHKHLDEDELFLVHEGVIALDTERGRITLHSEELVVVPKGLSHRSGSQLRSVVVLIRPTVLSDRKNGHRHNPLDTDPPLEKVRLARVQALAGAAYQAVTVAQVEDFALLLIKAEGTGPNTTAPAHGGLWLVLRGALTVTAGDDPPERVEAGELLLLPGGAPYQFDAAEASVLLTLLRSSGDEAS